MPDSSLCSNFCVDVDVDPMLFLRCFEGMDENSVANSGGNSETDCLLDESFLTMMVIQEGGRVVDG